MQKSLFLLLDSSCFLVTIWFINVCLNFVINPIYIRHEHLIFTLIRYQKMASIVRTPVVESISVVLEMFSKT